VDRDRILIVDDVPLGIKMLGEFLSREYEVVVATSGQKALEVAKSKLPDLILLDVIMPEMDGFETCRRLKGDPLTASIPVIFLTAMSDSDDVVRGLDAGGQDYIVKPFKKAEVLARIRTHIELKKAREKLAEYAREVEKKNRELENLLKKVELLAMTDHLTGLYNRRSALNLMKKELARVQRMGGTFAVLMIDVDDFKQVNDSYGHEGGDCVLKAISDLLREDIREYDIAARWGGEEFLVVLPGDDCEGGRILAERVRSLAEKQELKYRDEVIRFTLTAGVACFRPGDNLDDVIRCADEAMYRGKKQGKNQVVVNDGDVSKV